MIQHLTCKVPAYLSSILLMYSDVFEGHHLDRIHKGTVQAKHPAKTNMFDLQKPKKAYYIYTNQ